MANTVTRPQGMSDEEWYQYALQNASNPKFGSMPHYPQYAPAYDPNTMGVSSEAYRLLGGIKPNTQGIEALRGEALRGGQSSWGALREREQRLAEKEGLERISQEAMGQQANARAQLAMRGGLSGGAAERIAKGGTQNLISMRQNQRRVGQMERAGLASQDEANRLKLLSSLPGLENQALQPQFMQAEGLLKARGFDIGNQINEGSDRNKFVLDRYASQMAGYGAEQTANAQANAGKK